MVNDKLASLIRLAAVCRAVDFSRADLLSHRWWRMLEGRLRVLERQLAYEHAREFQSFNLRVMALPRELSTSDAVLEPLNDALDDMFSNLIPWRRREIRRAYTRQFQQGREAFIRATGQDPNSLEFKLDEARRVKAMLDDLSAPDEPTDFEKLTRELQATVFKD